MGKKKKKKKKKGEINHFNLMDEERNKKLIDNLRKTMPEVGKIVKGDENNKLSEAIIKFAEPLLEQYNTLEMQKRILSFAIIVWNMSFLSKKDLANFRANFLKGICGKDKLAVAEVNKVINYLLQRKKEHFSDDQRIVASYTFSTTKNGNLSLDVAYPLT